MSIAHKQALRVISFSTISEQWTINGEQKEHVIEQTELFDVLYYNFQIFQQTCWLKMMSCSSTQWYETRLKKDAPELWRYSLLSLKLVQWKLNDLHLLFFNKTKKTPTAWLKTISLLSVNIKHCGKQHASSWSRTKDIDCFALVTTSPIQSFSVTMRGYSCSYQSPVTNKEYCQWPSK